MMNRYDLYPSRVVWLESPKNPRTLVKVVKVNPKNIKVVKMNGERWNVHPTFLSPATTEEAATFSVAEPGGRLVMGTAVRFKSGATTHASSSDLYVVLGTHGGAYRLAKFGGDGGRYFTGIDSSQLEVVQVNEIVGL